MKAGFHFCTEGIEIDTSKFGKNPNDEYKAGSVDLIWQAANQVCRGFQGFLMTELVNRKKSKDYSMLVDFVVFPLIVTTAELFVCLIEDQNADISTGNSKGNLNLKRVPYAILNLAFTPNHNHLGIVSTNYQFPDDRGRYAQEGIIVVSAIHIKDFFNAIASLSKFTTQ